MAKANSAGKKRAANSVTESPGFTNGRARTERRIASGNRRSGSIKAIKAVPKAGEKMKASSKKTKK